jgi:hypothetical protein
VSLARARLDRFDLALLALFAALSLWTLALDLYQASAHGLVWTGSDAIYQEDGMQSMMWIEGILHHGASPDLFVLSSTSADYFQPLVALSALLAGVGVAPYLALLLWKPVAVAAAFFAVRAYVRGALSGTWARRAALVLALFFAWGEVIGDSWLVWWTWGYPFALIGLACALAALMVYARERGRGRIGPLPALLGALASWLHPWQGETLILVLLGCELALLLRERRRPPLAGLLLTVAISALPLAYFAALVHFDPVWQRERQVALSSYPLAHVASCMWPLALPALLAYRRRPAGFIALSARVWLPVALAIFLFSEWQGSGVTHALLGVTIPLGVLSVEGVRSLPWGALPWGALVRRARLGRAPAASLLAAATLVALTVPGTLDMLHVAHVHTTPRTGRGNFVTPAENAALAYLAHDPRGGGVLTSFYLGMVVPAHTGRRTYVGDCYWSQPYCERRNELAEKLLGGDMAPARARAFVLRSGARFVLGDCRSRDLASALATIVGEVRRFGCASVYVIR